MSTNINWAASLNYTGVLTADSTLTFTDPPTVGCICTATLFEDGTGGRGTQWPAGVVWLEGDVPHPDLRPNRPTQFTFYFAGAGVYYGHSSRSKVLYETTGLTTTNNGLFTVDSFTLKAKTIYENGQAIRYTFSIWGGTGATPAYQVMLGGQVVFSASGANATATTIFVSLHRQSSNTAQLATGVMFTGGAVTMVRNGLTVNTDTDLLCEIQLSAGASGAVDSGQMTVEYLGR